MNAAIIPIVPAIQLKRILFPTDFSEASRMALPMAAAIARRYGSELYAANVRTPLPYTMYSPEAVCAIDNKREREAREEMGKLLHGPELGGVPTSVVVETGDPAEELTRVVRDHDIDLAVLATHGRKGLMRLLMGSLAEELFRTLSIPVLTVGPRLHPRFAHLETIKCILYPTDLSAESRAALPYVASLAAEYRARVVVMHVLPQPGSSDESVLEIATRVRGQMRSLFCREIDPRCQVELMVDFGDAPERILHAAHECHADLMAFGVHRAGEASTHFRNTVAYQLVLQADCPVLTCRAR
jgi:nucleotide-binding universal stress UspA family protein